MVDLAKLTVRLEAESSKLRTELEKTNKKLDRFGKNSKRVVDGVKRQFVGLAAGISAIKLGSLVKDSIDTADNFAKLSQKVNISVESLSTLNRAADLSGSNIDVLAKGLGRLGVNAVDAARGLKDPALAFDALGIEITDVGGKLKSTESLLLEVADVFLQTKDSTEKSALAMKLFGRAGLELIPLLNQGSAGIREMLQGARDLGEEISTNTAKQAELFNDNLRDLDAISTGVANVFAQALLPTLNSVTGGMLEGKDGADEFRGAAEALNNILKGLVLSGSIIKNVFDAVGNSLGAVAATVVQAVQGNFSEALSIIRDSDSFIEDEFGDVVKTWVRLFEEGGKKVNESIKGSTQLGDIQIPTDPTGGGGGGSGTRKTAQDELRTAIESTTARLIEQNATFGLSAEVAEIEKLRLIGATDAQLMQVQVLTQSLVLKQEAAAVETLLQQSLLQTQQQLQQNVMADNALIASLQEEKLLLSLTAQEQVVYRAQAQLSANATLDQRDTVKQLTIELEGLKNTAKDGSGFEDFANGARSQLTGLFSEVLFDPFNANIEDMARNFIAAIGQMAAQALAADLVGALSGGGGAGGAGGGTAGSIVGIIGSIAGAVAHTGGFVGGSNFTRNVPAMAFAGAPHFETGGFPGIGTNEVPIIAHRGEEVLSANDPRNGLNGGGGGNNVRIINSIDDEFAINAMDSAAGEQVIMNHIQRNSSAVRSMISQQV